MRSSPSDVDPAFQDHKNARRDLAGCNNVVARRVGSALAEPRQPIDLLRLEHRKHLLAPGLDQRTDRLRHGFPRWWARILKQRSAVRLSPIGGIFSRVRDNS